MKCFLPIITGILFFIAGPSEAQVRLSQDSAIYQESIARVHQVYLNEIGDNAQIYHGAEYIRNGQKSIGFPYFVSDNMQNGSVYYQGVLYSNVNLFYNLISDELIVNNYPHNAQITLSPVKADSFSINNHFFVLLPATKTNGLTNSGYYEVLYYGEPGLFAKREKRLVVGSGSLDTKYIQYETYYIRIRNEFHPVDGKSAFLDLFKDQETALKKYIRGNKLNFKKDLESSLINTTIYYSRLKN